MLACERLANETLSEILRLNPYPLEDDKEKYIECLMKNADGADRQRCIQTLEDHETTYNPSAIRKRKAEEDVPDRDEKIKMTKKK